MKTQHFIKKGTSRQAPEIVELTRADAIEGGYGDTDLLSLAASEERGAMEELVGRTRGRVRELAGVEATVQRLEADEGPDPMTLAAARGSRRHLARLLKADRTALADVAARAEALTVAEGGPYAEAVRAAVATARGLVVDQQEADKSAS